METSYVMDMLNQLEEQLDKRLGDEDKRDLILSLLVLRQVNIEFEQEKYFQQGALEENLYIPSDLRWELLQTIPDPDLKQELYRALQWVQRNSARYGTLVLPESVQGNIGERELRLILDKFGAISGDSKKQGTCGITDVYECLCARWIPKSREMAGEFYTPRQVTELLIQFLQPVAGTVYDPCCGSGSLLIRMADHLSKHSGTFQLYGQEANPATWQLARMNAALRGYTVNLGDGPGEASNQDRYPDLKFDYVLANPPFGVHSWEQQPDPYDPRWKYGIPPSKRGEFAWLQHMLYHLKECGKMAIILSNGVLSSRNKDERRIRAGIVEDDVLEAIVTLPAGVFYSTKISVSFWVLNKRKEREYKNKILLIDARKSGVTAERRTVLPDDEMQRITRAYESYLQGNNENQQGFCRTIAADEIETEDYSLAPERYIVYERPAIPDIEKLEFQEGQLEAVLRRLMDESRENLMHILNRL